MTGGEWSSPSNYRSCCELAEAEVLLGFSHNRIFTRVTRVCAFDFIFHILCLHVCVQRPVYSFWLGPETCSFKLFTAHAKFDKQMIRSHQPSSGLRQNSSCACLCVRACVCLCLWKHSEETRAMLHYTSTVLCYCLQLVHTQMMFKSMRAHLWYHGIQLCGAVFIDELKRLSSL